MMRKSADWMTLVDDRVLEWLVDNGGAGGASDMVGSGHGNLRATRSYVSKRLNELDDRSELIERVGNGIYQITEKGESYLIGGYDVESGEYLRDIDPKNSELNGDRLMMFVRRSLA